MSTAIAAAHSPVPAHRYTSSVVIDISTQEPLDDEPPRQRPQRFRPSAARPKCFYKTAVGHCTNQTHWLIDGRAHCKRHFDEFWETHFVEDHRVVRLDQGEGY